MLHKTEIDAFISRDGSSPSARTTASPIEPVLSRWDRSSDLCKYGVSFLLYGLLDVIVDGYFETVQVFDDFYDEVSDVIFSERPLDPRSSATGSRCGGRSCNSIAWWCRCAGRRAA